MKIDQCDTCVTSDICEVKTKVETLYTNIINAFVFEDSHLLKVDVKCRYYKPNNPFEQCSIFTVSREGMEEFARIAEKNKETQKTEPKFDFNKMRKLSS